ncbi:MAG: hypothetical protein M9894_12490 [Planctomycetes bacterium]|nr:hypothetical protein [Planctomycetota bacterium]
MRRHLPCLLALAISCGAARAQTEAPVRPPNPLARDPWAGAYRSAELRLVLERRGDGYAGTIELGGQRLPLTARGGEQRLDGTFTSDGHAFPFTATLEGTTLVLASGGATHRLAREGAPPAANPAAPPSAPTGPQSAPPVGADWQTYRHALGWELRYPPGWQLQETEVGLVLAPPDLARDPQGQPLEAILVNAVPADGITRPDDPRALQFIEGQLQQVFPFLRRAGEPRASTVGGRPAAELTLAGKNPAGRDIRALVLIKLVGDQGVITMALGEPERLRAREAAVRQVFASAGKGEAQLDQRLVGVWRYERHTFSGTFSSTSIRTITLRPDGTCHDASRTFAGMDHKDSGGHTTGRTDVDTGDGDATRGTWAADGRRIILQWRDGTEEYEYELGGGAMLFKTGRGEPKLYQKVN